jgi:hypothetical protein
VQRAALVLATLALGALASTVLPHRFEAGTPAVAEHLVANFDTVDRTLDALAVRAATAETTLERTDAGLARVAAIETAPTGPLPRAVVTAGNHRPVGAVVGVSSETGEVSVRALVEGPLGTVPILLRVLAPDRLAVHPIAFRLNYRQPDCQGTPYLSANGTGFGHLEGLSTPFVVIGLQGDGTTIPQSVLHLPRSMEPEFFEPVSALFATDSGGRCEPVPAGSSFLFEGLPAEAVGTLEGRFPPPYAYVPG